MNKILFLIYIAGIIPSMLAIAGMVNANFRADFQELARQERWARKNLGFSIAVGMLTSFAWPIAIPVIFVFLGFGQDGWTMTWRPTHD